jgi:hypothetical protein
MHTPDPSWCARINAWKRDPSAPAAPAPPSPSPASTGLPEPQTGDAPPPPSPFRPREIPKTHVCELCGTVMYDHSCKIVCPNCGYKRDCSDP